MVLREVLAISIPLAWAFWLATSIIVYTYVGYLVWLWFRSHLNPQPIGLSPCSPTISIILIVRNEAATVAGKLHDLIALTYPSDLLEILVVSDGSTDETNQILAGFSDAPNVRVIYKQQQCGKASGLNDAMAVAGGDILLFTDARQKVDADAARLLMENFADPKVGCASGELLLGDPDSPEFVRGMGLYWKIEKMIRELESASGSVVGATGAFYAVRRNLIAPIPSETILDDVLIPMQAIRQGSRVVFDSRVQVWDLPDLGTKREFTRKVRTLSGNYQLLKLAPWLLGGDNPIRFSFVSHKLLRLIVPFALGMAFLSSSLLPGSFYRTLFFVQLAFYGLSPWALVLPKQFPLSKAADAAFTFLLLNVAATIAFVNFICGRKIAWTR